MGNMNLSCAFEPGLVVVYLSAINAYKSQSEAVTFYEQAYLSSGLLFPICSNRLWQIAVKNIRSWRAGSVVGRPYQIAYFAVGLKCL
jgi:hypothetical protein